jgi:N-acetylglucosamine-6-phosphate deacetylase
VDPAGLPDGTYQWERQPVTVKHGMVMLADGSSLAGSTLTMMGAVRNVMRYTGASLAETVLLASRNPARVLGLADRKGTIAAGMDADLVILRSDLSVQQTIVAGQTVYDAAMPA